MDNLFSSIASFLPLYNYATNQKKYTQPQANIANAMLDQNNPLYQQTYGQERQAGQNNLADVINQLGMQNRKLSMLGRTPLFDPERGGETMFRGLTHGYEDIQGQARANTLQDLGNAYQYRNNLAQQQQKNDQTDAFGQSSIGGVLKSLFGL